MTIRIDGPDPIMFFHLPKTAGMSISYWLIDNANGRWFPSPNTFGSKHADEKRVLNWLDKKKQPLGTAVMVIRNPWDRCVSAWKYWTRRGLVKPMEFDEWVYSDWKLAEKQAVDYFLPTTKPVWLRYENLDQDIKWFEKRLGKEFSTLERHNSAESDKHWREYYTPKLRDKVFERHNKDIRYFGYTFD